MTRNRTARRAVRMWAAALTAGACSVLAPGWEDRPTAEEPPHAATVRSGVVVAPPPDGRLYHGIHPGGPSGEEDDITAEGVRSSEQAVGKTAARVYFSHNWHRSRSFPEDTAEWIRGLGAVPECG